MRTLKLYATGSATGNAVAQLTIPSAATIRAIQYSILFDSVTDAAILRVELSRASATEIAVNGAQMSICEIGTCSNFVTSGLSQPVNVGQIMVNASFAQGQIIYFHAVVAGTLVYYATFILHY
jgi:hypothetical protein